MSNEILKTAKLFLARNGAVEVRAIGTDKTGKRIIASGYFDNLGALEKEASKIDSRSTVSGIYMTLNKPGPEHIHNLNQPISQSTKKLSDKHIDRYTWVLIDLDPERETGTNSTAEELEAARLKMIKVKDALEKMGFRALAVFMSGNGYHILIAVDLPIEDKTLVRDFLKALDHRFSDDTVKVDATVHNPARITKLYGTMTRKGPDTPERPQRRSAIESIPDSIIEVTREQLQAIVDIWGAQKEEKTKPLPINYPTSSQRINRASRTPIDVPAYCLKSGLEIMGTKIDAGSTIYQLRKCGFNSEHKDNDAAIIQGVDGVLRYQCFHNSCQGRTFQELCKHLNCYPDEWNKDRDPHTSLNVDGSWPEITLFDSKDDDSQRPRYPFEELPEAIYTASKEVSRFCKVSSVSPAIVGVSVIATAIGRKAVIEERPGLNHHPSLFIMGEAGPSERKTPTFKAMTEPLNHWAKNKKEEYATALAKVKFKNSVVDAAQSKKQSEAKKDGADLDKIAEDMVELERGRLIEPASPSLFTTDPTEQRLFQLMEAHDGAYAVLSGEGRPVINQILGRYSDGTGEALYLAGISGDVITRDRVGNEKGPEEKVIYDPCLNVCIMVQPDKALELVANSVMQNSGLISRIMRAELPLTAGSREEAVDEPGLNFFALEHYTQLVTKILDSPARETPHKVKLSPEVAERRRLLHNETERQLGVDGALSDVGDIAGKSCSQTVKLALIFWLAENPSLLSDDESEISLESWNKAEAIGRYHLQESVRLRRLTAGDVSLEICKKVAQWLVKKQIKSFKKVDLMRSGPRPRLNKHDAKDVLEDLIEFGVIAKLNNNPIFTVNPKLFKVARIATIAGAPLKNEKQKNNTTPATPAIAATFHEETLIKEPETLKVANSEFEVF